MFVRPARRASSTVTRSVAAGIAAGAVLVTVACGGDRVPADRTGPEGPAATTDVMPQQDHGDHDHARPPVRAYDPQKLSAFVTAFRTQYPDLAVSRDDDDIEQIATESCDDLANNMDPQAVMSRIVARAENDGTVPRPEQAREIYGLVDTVCS